MPEDTDFSKLAEQVEGQDRVWWRAGVMADIMGQEGFKGIKGMPCGC